MERVESSHARQKLINLGLSRSDGRWAMGVFTIISSKIRKLTAIKAAAPFEKEKSPVGTQKEENPRDVTALIQFRNYQPTVTTRKKGKGLEGTSPRLFSVPLLSLPG